jgi:hypothetical protein
MILDDLILTLCFETLPVFDLDSIQQRLANIEPLYSAPQLEFDKASPADLIITYEQQDPRGYGPPHLHTIRVTAQNTPIPDAKIDNIQNNFYVRPFNPRELLCGHTAHLRCSYESSGTKSPEPIIALYKVAYCFMKQGLLGLWDEEIAVCHKPSILGTLFKPFYMLNSSRRALTVGLWHNLLEFHRPGGGIWFYTKGQVRFGLPEFAYFGSATYRHIAHSLFRELLDTLQTKNKSLSVGDIIGIRPGLWISVSGLLEHQDVLESRFGTLVLQLHSEDSPNPEQNDPSFRLWTLPQP